MTDAPDDESKRDSVQPAAGVFGTSQPSEAGKAPGLAVPKAPAAGVFGGGGAKPAAAGVFGGGKPVGIPGGAPSVPGSVFGASKDPAAPKPAAAGAFGAPARPPGAAAGAFGAGPAVPAAPLAGVETVAAPRRSPSSPPLGPAPVVPKPRSASVQGMEAIPPAPRSPSATGIPAVGGPLAKTPSTAGSPALPTPKSPSSPGMPAIPTPKSPSSPGMPAVSGPFTAKSPSSPGMPAVSMTKSPSSLGIPSPSATSPAFQAAPRPGAPSSAGTEQGIDFPSSEGALSKPGEGSLLTLLPLEPEAERPRTAGAAPAKTNAPPMKAQIGGTARPSVLGTSKLSPTAKVPPKAGSTAPSSALPKPEPRTAVGKSVAPSTLSASLNQRTSNSVVGPLPKSGLGAPLRPGTQPIAQGQAAGRTGIPAPSYQRTGTSVVGPLPRPPLAGIGTSSSSPSTPRPEIAGVKVAPTTAVGTASMPPAAEPEARVGNAQQQPASLAGNMTARKSTMVGFQQPTVGSPYEHGGKDGSRAQPSFSDDFDDQPTLIGEAADITPYLEAERQNELASAPAPLAPVVPAADEFENAPKIRSSALGLLVPSEVIGTPRHTEPLDLSDDDLIPSNSLPPLALPPTSPHAVVPSALLDSPPEPPAAPLPAVPPAPAVLKFAAAPPHAPVPQASQAAVAPVAPKRPEPAHPQAFNSTVSGESTLIVRSRLPELEDGVQKPKRNWAGLVAGGLVVVALGAVGTLVATGKIKLPGSVITTGVATTTGAATTGSATTGGTTTATGVGADAGATAIDAGAVVIDSGVDAGTDAGFDAGPAAIDAGSAAIDAGVVAVAEPTPPVSPTPAVDPGDLSGITPDSQLPSSGPRASDILVDDALDLMEQGRLDAANVALTRAMERDRINPQGYEAVAKYNILRRDYAAAIAAATHATTLRPRDSRYYVVLGDAQLASGDRAAAQASWTQAVQIDRNRDARSRLEANP